MNIKLVKNGIKINGKLTYIRSGEIPYFRIKRELWEDRVRRAKQAHLNCISSYIPWFWHEPEEGVFDFTGETLPERDLISFLEIVKKNGLWFIARPGPFINAELAYGGHPKWIFEKYPEIMSKRADGEPAYWVGTGVPVPSQLHPKFLELVERWYEKVIPLLAKHSVSKNGHIILFQPDNEPNLVFTYGLDESLYDSHILGDKSSGTKGLWHNWLLETYQSLEELNKRYNTNFTSILDVEPPKAKMQGLSGIRLVLDWLKFKQWHIFNYLTILAKKIRNHGLELPYIVNEPINTYWNWRSGEHGEFSNFMKKRKEKCFSTGHCYLVYGGEQDNTGVPITIARIESVKLASLDGPTFIAELGCGWFDIAINDKPAYNWDLLLKLSLGSGMNGFNYYIYAGGQAPVGESRYGSQDYDWNAPIRANGKTGDVYEITKRFNHFIELWEKEILDTFKEYDLTIALFSELPLLAKFCSDTIPYKHEEGEVMLEGIFKEVHSSLVELLKVLTNLNVNFEFLSLNAPNKPVNAVGKLLVVPNPGVIPDKGFEFLLNYLKIGGNILFYPLVPLFDTNFNKREEFAKLLKLKLVKVIPQAGKKVGDIRHRTVNGKVVNHAPIDGRLFVYEEPDKAEVLVTYKGQTCAYKLKVLNGEVIVCGVIPHYISRSSQELFKEIFLNDTGVDRVCKSENESLLVMSRKGLKGNYRLVTVANIIGREGKTKIVIKDEHDIIRFPIKTDLEIYPKRIRLLWVNLPLPYATLKYCTSELIPLDDKYRNFLAYGDYLTLGEIAFDKKLSIKINGTNIEMVEQNGLWIATYTHEKEPLRIKILD
jgi:beta-galactosidase